MCLFSCKIAVLILIFTRSTAAIDLVIGKIPNFQTTVAASPLFITQIRSTTEFFVTCNVFGPGATLLSEITTSTITTIQPVVTSYPATVLETVISKVILENHFYYSNPSDDTISITSGFYTQQPTMTVVTAPPNIGPAAASPLTGSVCGCTLQPAHSITPCGAMCCISTLP